MTARMDAAVAAAAFALQQKQDIVGTSFLFDFFRESSKSGLHQFFEAARLTQFAGAPL